MGLRKGALPTITAMAAAVAVGGCSATGSPTVPRPAPATAADTPAPVTAPSSPPAPAPQTESPPSPDPATPGAPDTPTDSSCASVRTQNGPNLQVLEVSTNSADCAEAERLARDLAGRVAEALTGDPAHLSVQGLVCVPSLPTEGTRMCGD